MSKTIRPGKPAVGGFTLIELLVVIVIVGTMVALLTVAVMGAREKGRQTTCLNNQKQLAAAILGYDVSSGHFPGFVNVIPGFNYASGGTAGANCALNWCEVLLPSLERADLWAGDNQWAASGGTFGFRAGKFSPVKIGLFVCPNDGNAATPGIAAPLSYIVNSNVCNNRLLGGVVDVTIPQFQGSSRTLLLGEGPMTAPGSMALSPSTNLTLLPPPPPSTPDVTRQWNWSDSVPFLADYAQNPPQFFPPLNMTFTWPIPQATTQHLSSLAQLFPSYHPGMYIVTYCDGRAKILSSDTDCTLISTSVNGGNPFP